ncbi:LytR/AlgR family response regulator transcription factor [Erythrobacter ani]|uniref:Response regulator transcription factor n=1 Tax=Erythrobacter ani TaxID=2827235 RepID=A0ABS6SL26_9SPHN|nr:LytTR family DNA-binding domain-containing protein [Erythrobacter ani]MBV7265148.1 response regulator transcription factor [Erythrobacter ani]
MLRVAIVDDERLARSRLAGAIGTIPEAEVVCEAANGTEAIANIERENPSVVLLDIEMPHGDGFHVAAKILELPELPEIIFVTAFSNYAARAFEHGVTDYLLKPFSRQRLVHALDRAREHIRLKSLDERSTRLQQLVDRLRIEHDQAAPAKALWFRSGADQIRVFPDEIRFARADRDYVEIVTDRQTLHLRHTISALARELGDEKFARIHRSHIVKRSAVRKLISLGHGKYEIQLETGETVPVGAAFRKSLDRG